MHILAVCPKCGAKLPRFRKAKSVKQALLGGCTCPNCGVEVDWDGRASDDRTIGKMTIILPCIIIGAIVAVFFGCSGSLVGKVLIAFGLVYVVGMVGQVLLRCSRR